MVIALDATARDDLGGQCRESLAAAILRGFPQDDTQIGVAARDHGRDHELELVAAAIAVDGVRMVRIVAANRAIQVANNDAMWLVGHFGHFEDSSRQLVVVSLLDVGLQELLETHRSAVVGRTDA